MKSLSTAALIAALALSTASIYAAEPEPAAAADRQPPAAQREHHEHNRAVHIQKSLDKLQQQLHLKDNQQAGWSQYKTFVLNALSEHANNDANHRTGPAATQENLSTPERLQKLATHLRERAAELEKIGAQTELFYKALSPEQKTIFDLHWRNNHPRRHW